MGSLNLDIRTNDEYISQNTLLSLKSSILTHFTLHRGKSVKSLSYDHSAVVFITKGKIRVTSICADKKQVVTAGEMFLVPRGRTFHFLAFEDTSFLVCKIAITIDFCVKHPIDEVVSCSDKIPQELAENEFGLLPIHVALKKEILLTQEILDKHMDYEDFQDLKRELFMIYMRHFYTPEQKAYFLKPLLNEDMRFLSKVLEVYIPDITVNEFIQKSGMSASTFNRKFHKAFNMSLGQWLLRRKCDLIKEDLILTDMTIQEIAEKHYYTPNHLCKFCKTHFNQSPSEIRQYYTDEFYKEV